MPYCPPDLEEYFAPLAGILEAFSETKGVTLEKYYHDAPSWSLCFGHPNGGQAKIDVSATDSGEVTIQAVWWLDEQKTFTRSLLWGSKTTCPRAAANVAAVIESTFADALVWKQGNWTQIADGYQPYWASFSPESFESWANPWPLPGGRSDA